MIWKEYREKTERFEKNLVPYIEKLKVHNPNIASKMEETLVWLKDKPTRALYNHITTKEEYKEELTLSTAELGHFADLDSKWDLSSIVYMSGRIRNEWTENILKKVMGQEEGIDRVLQWLYFNQLSCEICYDVPDRPSKETHELFDEMFDINIKEEIPDDRIIRIPKKSVGIFY